MGPRGEVYQEQEVRRRVREERTRLLRDAGLDGRLHASKLQTFIGWSNNNFENLI